MKKNEKKNEKNLKENFKTKFSKKAGPKGRSLEVGARRAPRLLVYNDVDVGFVVLQPERNLN